MVSACYNKGPYIADMLESVLAQRWDNIEVVFVNDGSTDNTREIIAQYEPKLKARGYELVLIDQPNQGVAAAVKRGLMSITGEYVCMPDCDDELHPEYVSAMAGWLEQHPEDQWAVCDWYNVREGKPPVQTSWYKENQPYYKRQSRSPEKERYPSKLLENYLLRRILKTVWIIMLRASYMRDCGMMDSFLVDPPATQEPQVLVPLSLGGALPGYIESPLYYYYQREHSILNSLSTVEHARKFTGAMSGLFEKMLSFKQYEGKCDASIIKASRILHYHYAVKRLDDGQEAEAARKLVQCVREYCGESAKLNADTAAMSGVEPLVRFLANKVNGVGAAERIARKESGRIIACAAYGRAARFISTGLLNADIRPDVFWDAAAKEGDEIGGVPVMKPDFENLGADDVVLILLFSYTAKHYDDRLRAVEARDNIWYYYDVLDHLAEYYYGG